VYGLHPPRIIQSLLLIAVFGSIASPALAQNAPTAKGDQLQPGVAPEIRGVLANSQLVIDRLETAMNLTTPNEKKQFQTLKDFIEVFLIGVDVNKPVRMDVLTSKNDTSYRLDVPVLNNKFQDFWKQNLVPLGIPVQGYAKEPGLFRLGGNAGAAFTGFMLYDPKQRAGYATIVEDAKQLPARTGPDPAAGVQDLLQANFDAALRLQNKAEGVDQRHAHFAKQKDKVLGKLKRDTDESASDFNLRKFAAGIQFDESERLYSEAKDVLFGAMVDPAKAQAKGTFRLEALPDTSLDKAVALLGQNPSRFAGIPRGEGAATTGRINFALDEFRQQHLVELNAKLRENEVEEVDENKDWSAEEKEAGKQFLNGFFDLIDEGLKAGVIDGFIEMTKGENNVYTVVGGLKSPDATKWVPVFAIMPKLHNGPAYKENVGEHADVTFHEITLTQEQHPDFVELFGDGRLLFGTSKTALWYAAGPNAEETLKKSIDQAAEEGQADPAFVSFRGELLPGLRILDRRLGTSGFDKFRNLALEAFKDGDGRTTIELVRNGNAIDGSLLLEKGILRLVGKALADFSAQNLE